MEESKTNKLDETANRELSILSYWKENKTFEKSVELRPKDRHYVFYDGPPFATGMPHYGQLLGSTIKDVIPRYWTMKGYRVERIWGWDCHGLPIENMVEKELKIEGGKKGIESLGIEKFCDTCKQSVLRYDREWRKIIERIGRWVDMEHSYKTMDNTYIESVWWGFKKMFEKDLVYEGRRIILYCPRCSTPLSNFEIAMDNSYQDVEDESLFVKFKLVESIAKIPEYLLAWTTTPWTLPGNVALAVDNKADYVKVSVKRENNTELLILAKKRLNDVIKEPYEVVSELKGKDLLGLAYEPLYAYLPTESKKAYYVLPADFVSLEEGTGIVHTAAIYGEDDYKLAEKTGLPTVPMLDDEGKFLPFITFLSGRFFKEANPIVVTDLGERNLLYRKEVITHSYPFCYRCETPLYYNAVPAWFINIQKIKKELIAQNEKINWYPGHYKHGQFKKILESSPDWNISRSRYWGSPMPVWVCPKCSRQEIIGSLKELKDKSVSPNLINESLDLHRPTIDAIKLKCHCGGEMARITEVFDCWVESASMPFAAKHYPFENKEWFDNNYPADFIGEYSGQVRAWFNVLHRVSVALFGKPSFKNVSVTGVYLGTDGKKLSKSKKNYPDPMVVIDKYGVDALRFYMMGSSVMKAEDVIISEDSIKEVRNQIVNIFYNCFNFLRLYENKKFSEAWPKFSDILDSWIVSRTEDLVGKTTTHYDSYNTVGVCDEIKAYILDLSNWYLRRSRDRLKGEEELSAISRQVLAAALIRLCKVSAPVIPFISEYIYRDLTGEESVHLSLWPIFNSHLINKTLEEEMDLARLIVVKAHSARKTAGIKVKQPLGLLEVGSAKKQPTKELEQVILDEINVKVLAWREDKSLKDSNVFLDTKITSELKEEGEAREFVRAIQDLRKESECSVKDKIIIHAVSWPKKFEEYILKETLATKIEKYESTRIEVSKNS